ncbi:MAG: hypothetical protein JWQ27_2145 [Ferruginibacter sp.]|nr:hypothetical protein [Ferruginibacter sp.]
MKRFTAFIFFAYVLLSACRNPVEVPIPPFCDALVTDTTGTGDPGRVYMPNAFTPNNDGLNDISRPFTKNIASIVFTIYDSGDAVMYTTSQLNQGWQTTIAASSYVKYHYRIQATTNNGRHIGQCGELYKLSCFPVNYPLSALFFEDQLLPNGGFSGPTHETMATCP